MTTNVFIRKRAERFAELLDASTGRPSHHHHAHTSHQAHAVDERLAGLVPVGDRLTALGADLRERTAIDSGFAASLRDRLMAEAAQHGIGATAAATEAADDEPAVEEIAERRPRSKLLLAGGAVAGVLAISGVATASGSAVPGDTLYDVKRSTEQAQLALAGSDVNSGQLYLQFARTRMSEASALRSDATSLQRVLDDMDQQTRQGVKLITDAAVSRKDNAPLDLINGFVSSQRADALAMLPDVTDPATRQRLLGSIALIDQAQGRSTQLRMWLDCTAGRQLVTDDLGAVPQRCSAAPGTSSPSPSEAGSAPGAPTAGAPTTPAGAGTPVGGSPSGGNPGLPGLPVPTGSPTPSPTPSQGSGNNGGLLGGIDRILGGIL